MNDLILQHVADCAGKVADDYWLAPVRATNDRLYGLIRQCAENDSAWQAARDLLLSFNMGNDPQDALRAFASKLRKIAEGEK